MERENESVLDPQCSLPAPPTLLALDFQGSRRELLWLLSLTSAKSWRVELAKAQRASKPEDASTEDMQPKA